MEISPYFIEKLVSPTLFDQINKTVSTDYVSFKTIEKKTLRELLQEVCQIKRNECLY